MKTLFVLRHAKSSWKDKELSDFDRPLKPQGREAAETMGAFFKRKRIHPDLILSSPAVRAKETIGIILESAKLTGQLHFDDRIYEASANRLLEVVNQIQTDVRSALIVGHNPGLEELIALCTGRNERMPTAALAKLTFKTSNWTDVAKAAAKLEWVVKPKELEET
jgi:phosphohistidine phosphatase